MLKYFLFQSSPLSAPPLGSPTVTGVELSTAGPRFNVRSVSLFSTLIGRAPTLLGSHWSNSYIVHNYKIVFQRKCPCSVFDYFRFLG